MEKNKKIILISSLVVCFVLLFIYCFSAIHVGINDAGSLSSIRQSVGLKEESNGFFTVEYNYADSNAPYLYNGSLRKIIIPIIALSKTFSDKFDTRLLGLFYGILLLISIFYFIKYIRFSKLWETILFSCLLIFVFFDVAYLVYLNTLFPETAFYVFFVFALSLFTKLMFSKKPQLPTTIVYYLICYLICGLKSNLALLGIFFAIGGFLLLNRRKGYVYRWVSVFLALFLIVFPFIRYHNMNDYKKDLFHSVFYGILYEQKDVNKALKDLGLSESLNVLAGKTAYDALPISIESDEFQELFYNKISYSKIAFYYLKHPGAYLKQFKFVANNAFEIRPRYMGNFTADSGKEPQDLAGGFSLYSTVKRNLFPAQLWFVYLLPIILIGYSLANRKKYENKIIFDFAILLSVLSLVVFQIPMITYGLADIAKNMLLYDVVFDSMLLTLIGVAIYTTSRKKQEFKDKYGLTQ